VRKTSDFIWKTAIFWDRLRLSVCSAQLSPTRKNSEKLGLSQFQFSLGFRSGSGSFRAWTWTGPEILWGKAKVQWLLWHYQGFGNTPDPLVLSTAIQPHLTCCSHIVRIARKSDGLSQRDGHSSCQQWWVHLMWFQRELSSLTLKFKCITDTAFQLTVYGYISEAEAGSRELSKPVGKSATWGWHCGHHTWSNWWWTCSQWIQFHLFQWYAWGQLGPQHSTTITTCSVVQQVPWYIYHN